MSAIEILKGLINTAEHGIQTPECRRLIGEAQTWLATLLYEESA